MKTKTIEAWLVLSLNPIELLTLQNTSSGRIASLPLYLTKKEAQRDYPEKELMRLELTIPTELLPKRKARTS